MKLPSLAGPAATSASQATTTGRPSPPQSPPPPDEAALDRSRWRLSAHCVIAAFGTYFCVYALRKPFTAATFEGQEAFGLALKAFYVASQVAGYTISKFIGIGLVMFLLPVVPGPVVYLTAGVLVVPTMEYQLGGRPVEPSCPPLPGTIWSAHGATCPSRHRVEVLSSVMK